MVDFLIENVWFPFDRRDDSVHLGWLSIDGERIADLGKRIAPAGLRDSAKRRIDGTDCLMLPGLVNAHTHLSQTFMRGLAINQPLAEWLRKAIQPLQAHMTPDDLLLSSLLGIVENLRGGNTHLFQHHKITKSRDHVEATLEAARQSGIRMLLARGWRDTGARGETISDIEQELRQLCRAWDALNEGRIRIASGPMSPHSCTGEAISKLLLTAEELGIPTHIHISETEVEVTKVLNREGLRPVAWLHKLGALRSRTHLVHAIHLDEHELGLLRDSGATVVHCPISNLRLASGIAPLARFVDQGINTCLGSDGSGSNDTQDMLETVKSAALLANVESGRAGAISLPKLIEMATLSGAKAIKNNALGVLRKGAIADLSVFDIRKVGCWPCHRPLSTFVFSARGVTARDVWVNGHHLLDRGRITFLDEETLFSRCEEAALELFKRAKVNRRDGVPKVPDSVAMDAMLAAGE